MSVPCCCSGQLICRLTKSGFGSHLSEPAGRLGNAAAAEEPDVNRVAVPAAER